MADQPTRIPDLPRGPHRVRLHPEVQNDRPFRDLGKLRGVPPVDSLFEQTTLTLLACFVSALRQLEHWPPTEAEQISLAESLGIDIVECNDCAFFRGRIDADDLRRIDARLVERGELEFYFWPCAKSGDVWLLHTQWGKAGAVSRSVCRRAARRMHQIRGGYHDEGVDYR